jgi:hypothetical protein
MARGRFAIGYATLAFTLLAIFIAQPAGASPRLTASPDSSSKAVQTNSATPSSTDWQVEATPSERVKYGAFYSISCPSLTECVAVGYRLGAAGAQVPLAELWNGSNWSEMKGVVPPDSESSSLVSVSCTSTSSCIAVGSNEDAPLTEAWNGETWALMTVDVASTVLFAGFDSVSCSSSEQCVAVGSAEVEKKSGEIKGEAFAESWNSTAWTSTAVGNVAGSQDAGLLSVSCVSGGTCEAVGNYLNNSGYSFSLAEMWSGTSWATQKTPAGGSTDSLLNGVSCVSSANCVAVGFAFPDSLAETWNGTKWSIVATPEPSNSLGSELFGVSCTSATACVAVGGYSNSTSNIDETLALAWNGDTWAIEQSPSPSTVGSGLFSVSCISDSACTAVGGAEGTKNPAVFLVEVWNGTMWSTQQAFQKRSTIGASLYDVSCSSATSCLAVGSNVLQNPIADIWNGSSWKAAPAPAEEGGGGLYGVACITASDCIAVGAPDTDTNGLAEEWNGKTWTVLQTPIGTGDLESVSCTSASSCIAVGTTLGEDGPVPLAESWNGTDWTLMTTPAVSDEALETELFAVSCSSANSCEAVGVAEGEDGDSPIVYSWNGAKWATQSSATTPFPALGLTGVACTSSDSCEATGYSFDRLQSPEAFAETWNGTKWTSQKISTPKGGAIIYGLGCSSSDSCVTVGGSARGGLAEAWNGTSWSLEKVANPAGAGTSAYLDDVSCVSSGSCSAVGDYTNSRGLELTLAEGN